MLSYLYGEIGSEEKIKFESHLDHCRTCDDELASFGFIRSKIEDWREESFSPLENPPINIHYGSEKTVTLKSASQISLTERIRQLFFQTPFITAGSAAFAVLLLVVGLILFFNGQTGSPDRAEVPPPSQIEESPAKAPEKTVQAPQNELVENPDEEVVRPSKSDIADNDNKKMEERPQPVRPQRMESSVKKELARKDGKRVPQNQKPNSQTVAKEPSGKNKKPAPKPAVEELPIFSNFSEAEDDETLRLADLFDEVGSKK